MPAEWAAGTSAETAMRKHRRFRLRIVVILTLTVKIIMRA
jgi:hypothetical protein